MTQEANNYEFPSCKQDLALYVEQLVGQTNEDLKKFRLEQAAFHSYITSMMEENQILNSKLDKSQQEEIKSNEMEHLRQQYGYASEALEKALSQIEQFKKDRCYLVRIQDYANQTIQNMEAELKSYRAEFSKSDKQQLYDKSIDLLQQKLTAQHEKLETQANMIKILQDQKQQCNEQLEEMQARLKRCRYMADNREGTEDKIISLHKQLKDCHACLKQTRMLLDKSTNREKLAMQKAQEAILISEAAVREKEEADKLTETYKEEAAQLANNIGTIMDEAAKRVDNEVDQLRAKLSKRDKTIISLREKLANQLAEHKSMVEALESRYNGITKKYDQILKQNEKLEEDLDNSNKRLVEMQQCLNSTADEQQQKSKKDYDPQIESYKNAFKEMKAHYKEVFSDLDRKYQTEYEKIAKEKDELWAENEILRNGPSGDGVRKFL